LLSSDLDDVEKLYVKSAGEIIKLFVLVIILGWCRGLGFDNI